jgi:ABC-type phosphate transport system substrate-binding protein
MQKVNLHSKFTIFKTAFCFVLVSLFGFIPLDVHQELIVIGNPSTVKSNMSKSRFDEILHGSQTKWDNGEKVMIALMKFNHPTGKLTANELYNMSGNEMNRLWLNLVFEGKADGPATFSDEGDLVDYVLNTPSAIGIVSKTTNVRNARKITVK